MIKIEVDIKHIKKTLPKESVKELKNIETELKKVGVEGFKIKVKGIWIKVF